MPSIKKVFWLVLGMSLGASSIIGLNVNLLTAQAASSGSSYVPLPPVRILDTRVTGDPIANNTSKNLTVVGIDTVPDDATAVALNVTVTQPTNASFLTVYPAGESVPSTSNLNFLSNRTVANLTVVQVGENGQVGIYNAVGTVQVIVDLQGYFIADPNSPTSGSYIPLSPTRITDTRDNSNEPNSGHNLTQGGTVNVQVAGVGGVPIIGAEAAVLNVTITDTSASSYATIYPFGTATPLASTENWAAGQTIANRAIVPLGTDGQVSVYNSIGTADLVVDVVGYFADGSSATIASNQSLYYPINPTRLLDTRVDAGTLNNTFPALQLAGVDGISNLANDVVANITSTNASNASYFTAQPTSVFGSTSDVNFTAGQTVPNLTFISLNNNGATYVYNAIGTADIIIDAFGYFQPMTIVSSSIPGLCTTPTFSVNNTTSTQGVPVLVSASSTCGAGATPQYEYFYQPSYSSAWILAQSWTTSNTYSYTTSNWAPGSYHLAVWASSQSAYQGALATASLMSDATVVIPNITYSPQLEGMTCEEASLQMGLSHERIVVSQQKILNTEGVNESVLGIGPSYTKADPMVNFVGYPNGGSDANYEPGAYYGAVASAAVRLGGDVLAAGENISPTLVYSYIDQGHPVEAWVTFDFHVNRATTWLTNGVHTWPWAGPDEHAVLVIGVNNNSVLIDNPWPHDTNTAKYAGADQWVPMSTFQAVYAVYNDMAVVFS